MEENYKKIIRYFNYQKIKVNIEMLKEIKDLINNNKQDLNNISFNSLKRISRLRDILQDIKGYEYYIFIIETLPNYLLKNIFRIISYKWTRQINVDKLNLKKISYDINQIEQTKNIKDLFILELENQNNQNYTNFCISSINEFFI
uniref:Uncharacterized protein n=1 Tax=Mimiviridae sp. ChoanoV1 TaxID=2596887 RepID=A0A5B8IQ16_9VIRU|nr:hypothetical protein 3_33 [Mimiviridae sp. ChoanoV1]